MALLVSGAAPAPAMLFFFNDTATTEIYTLSLHDALPISHATPHACVRSMTPVPCPRSHLQLIADRQASDSFSRRREDRVAQGRRDRRHAGLAHAAHRLAVVAGDDVHANLPRRPGHPGHLVGVEVVLLHATALEADLTERRDADAHHARALHLGAHPVRVDPF